MTQVEIDIARVLSHARDVCAAAHAEGWLTSPVAAPSPLRQAVRRLAELLDAQDDRHGVPTMDDVVSFAGTISDDGDRASALSDLVPYVDEAQLPALLRAGHAIGEEYQRCRVFVAAAPRASAGQLAEMVAAVRRLSLAGDRMFGLVELAPHLDGAGRADAIDAALDAIEQSGQFFFVCRAVERLAPHLTPAQLDRALAAAAGAVTDEADRSNFLTRLASLRPAVPWAEAVSAAAALGQENLRAVTLSHLARQVPGEHLDAVVAAAREIDDDSTRAWALAEVAPHLPEARRPEVIDAALAALLAAPVGELPRTSALSVLLPLLSNDQVTAVLDNDARDPSTAAASLGAAAQYAAPERLLAAVAAAIAPDRLGHALTDVPIELCHVFARIVPYLPAGHRNPGALSALSLRDRVGEYLWADIVARVAAYLTPAQLDEVLASAGPPGAVSNAIGHLAAHLGHSRLGTALAGILTIDDEHGRGRALARIAPHLAEDHLDRLVAAVLELHDPQVLAETITLVLPHTPADRQPRLAQTALSAASAVHDTEERIFCLLALAAVHPGQHRGPALARAFTAMSTVTDGNAQTRMLDRMVPLVAAPHPGHPPAAESLRNTDGHDQP